MKKLFFTVLFLSIMMVACSHVLRSKAMRMRLTAILLPTLLVSIFMVISLTGCNDGENEIIRGPWITEYCIPFPDNRNEYDHSGYHVTSIKEVVIYNKSAYVAGQRNWHRCLDVGILGKHISEWKSQEFKALQEKFHDTGVWYESKTPYTYWCGKGYKYNTSLSEAITDIDIVTLDDFDANHPAGSLLNDVFEISYRSDYEYVKSGYSKDLKPRELYYNPDLYYGLLSDKSIYPIRLLMMGYNLCFTLTDKATPEAGKAYHAKVKMQFETHSSECDVYLCITNAEPPKPGNFDD